LSVLGPVGEVAHHLIGRCCMGDTREDLSIHYHLILYMRSLV
jgi:hypothetical protein